MAVIDVAGFVADLKDHAVDHQFHVHDERHFVETYSLRQAWEVDLHPEDACGGPLDLHLALEVDPRTLLTFEDRMIELPEASDPPEGFAFPLVFTWVLPPLPKGPDLLVLATELAGMGGTDLPLEVSAIDSFAAVTDAAERSLTIVSRVEVGLDRIFLGQEQLCDILDRCHEVSSYLLDRAPCLARRDMTGRMHLVDFVAGIGNESTGELLDEMQAIDRAANGWVNIRPRPEDNPDPSAADLAPTPPPSPLNIFGRRRVVTIEGTWVPGRAGRTPPEPASVGLEHPAGRFAVRQLRDGGLGVPDDWKVVTDHARRGLVLSVPASDGSPGDRADHLSAIVEWLVAAAAILAPEQVTGRWQAEVHLR